MKHRGAVKQPFHLGHHCTSIFFRHTHTHTQSAIVFKYAPNRRQTHGLQCRRRRRRRQHDTPLFTLKFSLESNCVLRYLLTRLQCTGEWWWWRLLWSWWVRYGSAVSMTEFHGIHCVVVVVVLSENRTEYGRSTAPCEFTLENGNWKCTETKQKRCTSPALQTAAAKNTFFFACDSSITLHQRPRPRFNTYLMWWWCVCVCECNIMLMHARKRECDSNEQNFRGRAARSR